MLEMFNLVADILLYRLVDGHRSSGCISRYTAVTVGRVGCTAVISLLMVVAILIKFGRVESRTLGDGLAIFVFLAGFCGRGFSGFYGVRVEA